MVPRSLLHHRYHEIVISGSGRPEMPRLEDRRVSTLIVQFPFFFFVVSDYYFFAAKKIKKIKFEISRYVYVYSF